MSTFAAFRQVLRTGHAPTPAPARRFTMPGAQTVLGVLNGQPVTIGSEVDRYSRSAVAYRCLDLIASNLASVPMVVQTADGEVTEEHAVARLWNDGAPGQPASAQVVRKIAWWQAELRGVAYLYIERANAGNTGQPVTLHNLFDRVVPVVWRGESGTEQPSVGGYIVKRQGGDVALLPSDVLSIRYPHPDQPFGCLAPWHAALGAVEADEYARAWQTAEFRNGARPSAIIDLGTVSAEQYAAAVAAIRTRVDGVGNAGKSIVVGSTDPGKSSAKVQHLSLSPAEMSYLESRVANTDEVCMAFGVNPDLLRAGSTYENRAAAKTALWSDTLMGKLDTAASEVDRQLLPDPAQSAGWDLSQIDALRDSQDSVIARASNVTYPDIATIDEARAMVGLEPLPGGLGGLTLTAYREHVRMEAAAALQAALLDDRSTVRLSVRVNGRTRTVRRTTRKKPTQAQVLARYDAHERVGRRAIARLAERQEKAVLRELKKARDAGTITKWRAHTAPTVPIPGAPAGQVMTDEAAERVAAPDVFDLFYWTAETRKALEDFLDGVWQDGGQRTAGQFDVSWDQFNDDVTAAMRERLDWLAGRVSRTTYAAIDATLLREAAADGASIDTMAAALRGVFTDLSTWRAQTIARTETVGGFNASSHRVALASGLVVSRSWLATSDDRTRPSHERINGETVKDPTRPYSNGLMHPGDPAGPAGEIIDCRCVETFNV